MRKERFFIILVIISITVIGGNIFINPISVSDLILDNVEALANDETSADDDYEFKRTLHYKEYDIVNMGNGKYIKTTYKVEEIDCEGTGFVKCSRSYDREEISSEIVSNGVV